MLGQIRQNVGQDFHYKLACWQYKLAASDKKEPIKVLVNGSPKTGTTWMLRMITSVPGYKAVGNYTGEYAKYSTVRPGQVLHGHEWFSAELDQILSTLNIRVVLMVRDPRDQLVSRMFHIKRSPAHAWHERFKGMSDDEALMLCIEGAEGLPGTDKMIGLTQTWLDARAEALIVKYEELLEAPTEGLNQVLTYLNIPKTNKLVGTIVARNRFERLSVGRRIWRSRRPGQEDKSSHFRKGIVGDWRNYLKEAHIQRFKEVAGQQLVDLGYEQSFEWDKTVLLPQR